MEILVAEDDRITRDLLRRMIEREGQDGVTFAEDGEDAWRLLNQADKRFDACLLDMCMPKLGGLDLLSRMQGSEPLKRVAVVICTAVQERATVQRAGEMGVRHYLVKPFSRQSLIHKLAEIRAGLGRYDTVEDEQFICERFGVDSERVVCDRLGIDPGTHRLLLRALASDADGWCQELRAAARAEDMEGLLIRGQGIRGSCLSLGLRRPAEQLAGIEHAIHRSMPGAARPEAKFPDQSVVALIDALRPQIRLIAGRFPAGV